MNEHILKICPLCGALTMIEPGVPPSDESNIHNYKNRCGEMALNGKHHIVEVGSKHNPKLIKSRSKTKRCRFPLTDANGNEIKALPVELYKSLTQNDFDPDKLAEYILNYSSK